MNIQQSIIEGLRQQLYLQQYIVLPGFGGFVLKPRPAHFSAQGTQLFPPSKTVSFNAQLKQNDGILTAWLQEKIGCTAAEAFAYLGDFTGYCKGVLGNRRRLSLPGIGFFHLDFENNVCFEPQADHNFLAESFGLSPVTLPEATEVPQKPVKRVVFADRKIAEPLPQQTIAARVKRSAVPIMLLIALLSILSLLVSVSTFSGELKAALFGDGERTTYTPVQYQQLDLAKPVIDHQPLVADANGIAALELGCNQIAVDASQSAFGNVEIVLGCFSVPSNARKMLRQLKAKGITAALSDKKHKGMVVVTFGSYPDKNSALTQLASVKEVIPAAWIKQK